jgi:hypothetical protein
MEKGFIESEGYVIGGTYKIGTTKLEEILKRYKTKVLEDMGVEVRKLPNDADLGREVRKVL